MNIAVLGIAGSLRAGSFNAALLRAALALLPEGMTLEIADIRDIPFFNGDVEARGIPGPVQALKQRIAAADALLIATPEYNYSVPGVLKNAIDWVSRPPDPPLHSKPAALMGASTSRFGTVRAQHHLRQIAVRNEMLVLAAPEVHVANALEKFSPAGELIHDKTREAVCALLAALKEWTLRLRGG